MNTRLPQFTEPELLQKIEEEGELIHYAAGKIILQPGKRIKIIPLILQGSVKILRVDNNGNELFLYYITQGQSCASSLSAFMNDKLSTIKALAESDTDLIAIPINKALLWFNEYPSWRKFVLQTMESRFEQLIHTVDTIAFSKIDDRLISFLINKAQNNSLDTIKITHQTIANELSTSREVISRLLKQLEKNGKIELGRNKIKMISLM